MSGKVLIQNLASDVTEEQLRELLSTIDHVYDFKWMSSPGDVPDRPAALVRMKNDVVAWEVITRLNAQPLNGTPLEIVPTAGLLSRQIAARLGERDQKPLEQIEKIVTLCGHDYAREILDETLRIEAEGGLMLPDNSRRRTPGGVYFYLVRNKLDKKLRLQIFPASAAKKSKGSGSPDQAAVQPPALPPLVWAERINLLRQLMQEQGKATTVKVTLIGRPGRVEVRQSVVVTTMENVVKGTFPKGIPTPPQTPTTYAVYIGAKQWRNVEEALANPEDVLIVEGSCAYDPDLKGIAVFATNVVTKFQQQAKRTQQMQAVAGDSAEAPTQAKPAAAPPPPAKPMATKAAPAQAAPKPAAPIPQKPVTPPPPAVFDGPPPPEAIKELARLRQVEDDARNRLDEIKALPADEQTGLGQTLREVQQAKDAIKALLQKYPRLVK